MLDAKYSDSGLILFTGLHIPTLRYDADGDYSLSGLASVVLKFRFRAVGCNYGENSILDII